MQIITSLDDIKLPFPSAVAIGKFDGIHLGHRQLLGEIIAKKQERMQAVVFTFNPSPNVLFSKDVEKELTSLEEKRQLFENLGVDVLVEFPLTYETAATEKEVFVKDILVNKLNAKFIVAGSDLSFGKNGEGNSTFLLEESEKYDFSVKIIDKIAYKGEIISSTLVRKAIADGDVKKARFMLGSPYLVQGVVEKGKQLGRTIGFPTVNISPEKEKLLPPNGVYKTEVIVDGRVYEAITNVGCKPTVTDDGRIFVESYLYNFMENIYGKKIEVYFLEFMRKEQKFSSVEELKKQLQTDMQLGQKISAEV
ncbi:MAG: bifunctional riboflavin kinase/FAD synthetase [Lachnospiraceae bacterium]|nr:bifunctional riboflavin kinase/FAD synthetase [Lachnospiraceae bacterium]